MASSDASRGATSATGAHHPPGQHRLARLGVLRELDRPADVLQQLGPDWFTSVMGTGIVATAAASLPAQFPGLRMAATCVWALAALVLTALVIAWLVHETRHRQRVRQHVSDPVLAQFWGAPAMALLTVGTGTLQLGTSVLGTGVAVTTAWVLWSSGTALGLVTTAWIPYLMITRHDIGSDSAFGGWLMPIVPPMVSAADGAVLIDHLASPTAQLTMLLACYAMFGASLLATLALLPQIWNTLVVHGPGAARTVPTMWIVLGPLGQSITATNLLGQHATGVLPAPYATGATVFGLFYGIPTWGFAMIWMVLAAAVTLRTARRGLPFALSWWSFTFPLGTCVTGTSALAARTHLPALVWAACALYALLVGAWMLVVVRTVYNGAVRGDVLASG